MAQNAPDIVCPYCGAACKDKRLQQRLIKNSPTTYWATCRKCKEWFWAQAHIVAVSFSTRKVVRVQMTEEQFDMFVEMLGSDGRCPDSLGFKGYRKYCGYATETGYTDSNCERCIREALKPETIPAHKGKGE